MRLPFLTILCLTGSNLLAQTREIALKSHSGNMKNFKVTLTNELFDEVSDFGLPAPTSVKTYQLDSVIYVSDSVSVIVIREYRRLDDQPKESAKLFRVGKDTLYRDPLLTNKHSLDSIKRVLGKLGYYVNPIKSVVFVGYDNKSKAPQPTPAPQQEQEKNIVPVPVMIEAPGSGNSPLDGKFFGMLGAILLLSLMGGWISWRSYQPRFQ